MSTQADPAVTAVPRSSSAAAVVPVILIVHALMLAWAAGKHSPTLDEPAHLVAGVSYWQLGQTELYCVNPPLVPATAAVPVVIHGCQTQWTGYRSSPGGRPEFAMGNTFVAINRPHSRRLFTIARWACLPFSVIGAAVCFAWARELWRSTGAGLVALVLWCFEPNILAHGELLTPDCAAAGFGLLAGYTFWRWLQCASWARATPAGIALGLAELSKMSWLILFGLWPLLWIVWRLGRARASAVAPRSGSLLREAMQLGALLGCAVYVMNLAYGFDGSCTPIGQHLFVSQSLTGMNSGNPGNRFKGTFLAQVPVPLPKHYLAGLDLQRKDLEWHPQPSYLRGEWKNGGWWYYYIYGLLVKVPHGTQLLMAASLCLLLASLVARRRLPAAAALGKPNFPIGGGPATSADLVVLLAPPLLLLAIVSSQTAFNHNLRYVLPGFGFAFVWCSGVWPASGGRRLLRSLVVLALGWTVWESTRNHPHNLAYFNELAGGPESGHRHLLHSNLDWGQDLYYLPTSTAERPLFLISYGLCDPGGLDVGCRVVHVGVGRGNDFTRQLREIQQAQPSPPLRFAVSRYYWDEFEAAVAKLGGTIRQNGLAGKSIVLCDLRLARRTGPDVDN